MWMTTYAAEVVPYKDHQVAFRNGVAINLLELQGLALRILDWKFTNFLQV
jgi:hypothetical protein